MDEQKKDQHKQEAIRIGAVIRTMRNDRGWSQAELAEKLGCSSHALSARECGRFLPSSRVAARLASVFQVSETVFLSGYTRFPAPSDRKDTHFRQMITEARKVKHLRVSQVARMAAIAYPAMFAYDSGRRLPSSASTVERLADALGMEKHLLLNAWLEGHQQDARQWLYQVTDGPFAGQGACIIESPAKAYKSLLDDGPDPVWCEFEEWPAQWFPRGRLQTSSAEQ